MELGGSDIVPPMVTRVVDRQLTALAVSTVSSYGSKWRRFANYCSLNGVSACPAAEVTVLAWMEEDLDGASAQRELRVRWTPGSC